MFQEVENQALKHLIGQLQARVLCLSEDNTEVDRTDPGNNVLSADFSAQKVTWSVCSRSEDRDFSTQMGQFMISAFEKYKEIRQDPGKLLIMWWTPGCHLERHSSFCYALHSWRTVMCDVP